MMLDDFQRAAATTRANRVVVPAAAGSGKTTTLVARITFMVEELHIHPKSIVVITFTRYAARSMKQKLGRLGKRLGYLGTIHAWLLNVLKEHGRPLGWEGDWLTILDEQEAEAEMETALIGAGLKSRRGEWTGCRAGEWDAFLRLTFQGDKDSLDALGFGSGDFGKLAKMKAAMGAYMLRLRAENAMTFDMIISEAHALLKSNPAALSAVRGSVSHLLVDEVQDTDDRQWDIIDMIAPDSLYVVGDVDQSLYSWRGARPRKMIDLALSDDVTVLFLPKSYRFGHDIAQHANRLIGHNKDRLALTIRAAGVSEDVAVMESASGDALYESVMEDVAKSKCGGGDVCVLARTHAALETVADKFRYHKIKYDYPGSKDDICKTVQHRIVKGLLRLMNNPDDKRGFVCLLPALDLPDARLLELREESVATGKSMFSLLGREDILPAKVSDVATQASILCPRMVWNEEAEFIDKVQLAEGFTKAQDMLNHFAMASLQDSMASADKRDKPTLSTIHGAKGLEWPIVYLIGMNEGVMPSAKSMTSGNEDEERRCAYVGMTRAQKKLKMVHMESDRTPERSRFLNESTG